MQIIRDRAALTAFCDEAAKHPYLTVDTEFLRERTYFAQLCLVQIAMPGEDDETAAIVDPLADGISLEPLFDLFRNPDVVKVFHAARQDLEIFWHDAGFIPTPFFDTQVAAMVCGFGDQVGYERLVKALVPNVTIDKSSRFTDWSRRPLSDAQKKYALADVTHLRGVYEKLLARLEKTGRTAWVEEELAFLTDPDTYRADPTAAWERIKIRSGSSRFLATVRALATFREQFAQDRNIPRGRVFKDDALLEIASARPKTVEDLGKSRLLLRDARKGVIAEGILRAVAAADAIPKAELPNPPTPRHKPQGAEALSELLRVLLKARADAEDVAQKLIASSADLDAIAAGDDDVAALKGWRRDVFGADALRLRAGEIALSAKGSRVEVVAL
ncbi:ribonuclease D [Paracoccaceae bacterium GXU_MW_L88]